MCVAITLSLHIHSSILIVPVYKNGGCYARAMVRVDEVNESVKLIQQALNHLPGGSLAARLGEMPAWEPAWGLVEGWRGAILHWLCSITTDNSIA